MAKNTISIQTRDRYRRVVVNLRKQAAYKYNKMPEQITIPLLCRHLIERHPFISASTWRSYRAAIFHVYGYGMERSVLNILNQIPGGGKKPNLTPYGARQKMKSFPDLMLNETLRYLSTHQTKIGNALWLWLSVGIETGLRPFEWYDAEIISLNHSLHLKVKNAKNTNGRANGPYRHLNLDQVDPTTLGFIRAHLQVIQAIKISAGGHEAIGHKKYNTYYSSCRRRLKVVVRRLWPDRDKYPSLYSLRHQFIANAKADGFTLEEIAAMCGQASADTPSIHYGRKQNGTQGRVSVRPKKDEVLSVRKSSDFHHRNAANR